MVLNVYLRDKVDSLLTPVVLANMEDIKQLDKAQGSVIAGKDIIFTVQM
jgi:PTS system glucose-specific IIA component